MQISAVHLIFICLLSITGKAQVDLDYQVFWTKNSLLGTHQKAKGYFEGKPVFNAIRSCHSVEHQTTCIQEQFIEVSLTIPVAAKVMSQEAGYWLLNNKLEAAICTEFFDEQKSPFQAILVKGKVIWSKPLFAEFIDTTIVVKVFNPNPIVTSGSIYGGQFSDNNDVSNMSLDMQLTLKNCEARYENSQFELANEWVKMVDVSPPNEIPFTSPDPQFFYNRSALEFESVNAFYHATQICKRIENNLGFTNFIDQQIHIDAHALNGEDNSRFRTIGAQPQLLFGQGGVDDAEDGQVVIHEMGHALSYFASPGTNVGAERQAIDEGLSDYFAVAYTEEIVGYSVNEIPTWDGHNEFWKGRITNSDKVYPTNFIQDIYQDAEIWSSVIKEIHEAIGGVSTEKALLESMFSYQNYMTMPEAAQYFITADSLLNSGANTDTVKSIFCKRGLYGDCDLPADYTKPVTVNYEYLGEGVLRFTSNVDEFDALEVYSMSGQKVAAFTGTIPTRVVLKDITPGVYILHLYKSNRVQNLKIILY